MTFDISNITSLNLGSHFWKTYFGSFERENTSGHGRTSGRDQKTRWVCFFINSSTSGNQSDVYNRGSVNTTAASARPAARWTPAGELS